MLEVSGPLDLALAPQLRHAISRAERLRPRTLVIDLTGATFLASAGMTELVRAHRSADGVTVVRIVASGRLLMRPLEITRLTDELDIRSTLDAALAAV